MKVLMLNGSPRKDGNTSIALEEMKKIFEAEGVETEIVRVGNKDVRGCIACGRCYELGKCVFDDVVNELAPKFEAADGLVIASPVYYASANATLIAVLDRLFYSSHFDKTMKIGASVVCARRGGCSATFDELNKYFTISNMPIASSQYWNSIHGRAHPLKSPYPFRQECSAPLFFRHRLALPRPQTLLCRSQILSCQPHGSRLHPSGRSSKHFSV